MYDFYMKNKTNIFIFIVWFAISLFAIFHHEMWRDETQVWCIVRDLNLPEIFQTTRIEGHPMLWYLLVLPFAKLGLAVESIQIISFIFKYKNLTNVHCKRSSSLFCNKSKL